MLAHHTWLQPAPRLACGVFDYDCTSDPPQFDWRQTVAAGVTSYLGAQLPNPFSAGMTWANAGQAFAQNLALGVVGSAIQGDSFSSGSTLRSIALGAASSTASQWGNAKSQQAQRAAFSQAGADMMGPEMQGWGQGPTRGNGLSLASPGGSGLKLSASAVNAFLNRPDMRLGGWASNYPQPGDADFMGPMPALNQGPTLMGSQTITAGKNAGGLLAVLGQNGYASQSDKMAAAGYLKVMAQWAPGGNVAAGQQFSIDRDMLEAGRPEFERIGREAVSAEGRQRAADERAADIARIQSLTRYSQADRQADSNYVVALNSQQLIAGGMSSQLSNPNAVPSGAGWFDTYDGTGATNTNGTYRANGQARSIETGRFAKDALSSTSLGQTMSNASSGVSTKWEGLKYEYPVYSFDNSKAGTALYRSDTTFLGVRDIDRGLGKVEFVATSWNNVEAKAVFNRSIGGEYGNTQGSVFGAKYSGNVGTTADGNFEAVLGVRPSTTGPKINAYAEAGGAAAYLRAQGELGYDIPLGPLTLTPKVGGEAQFIGLGASFGGGYKSYETRTGGSFYVKGGITPLVGGVAKFSVSWDWNPAWRWNPDQ